MKIFVLVSFFLFILSSISVLAQDSGECFADWRTKKYIDPDFSLPYPKKINFTCDYKCNGKDGLESIRGTHSVTVGSISEDAKLVVCQGVQVSKRSWGYDYDKTVAFYAHLGNTQEVKDWARKSISRDNSIEEVLLLELREELLKVGSHYLIAGASAAQFDYFKQAGIELYEIAEGLPGDTSKLDEAISFYKEPLHYAQMSKERLVSGILKVLARFRY